MEDMQSTEPAVERDTENPPPDKQAKAERGKGKTFTRPGVEKKG